MFHRPHEYTTLDLIGFGFLALAEQLNRIEQRIHHMAADLTEIKASVAATTTVEQSAIVLLNSIGQQLRDALASGDPQALADLSTALDTGAADLAAAVTANTTPAPVPAPAAPAAGLAPPDAPIVAPGTAPEVADPTNLNNVPEVPPTEPAPT